MKKISIIIGLFIAISQLSAQQYIAFSQYMLNYYSINPGVAGTKEYMPIAMGYHQSWTGFTNAPNMQMISGHTSINNEMGVGGKIYNYTAGPSSKTGFEGTYTYRFDLGNDMKLSLGLSALLYQMYLDVSKLDLKDADDDVLYNSSASRLIVPDAAFGAYFYTKNYFAGLSVAQLVNRKVDFITDELKENQVRHYYLIGGYNYKINDNFTVQPSVMGKFIEAGIFQADVNAKVLYKEKFFAGLSYRTNDAGVVLIGVDLENLTFGYSYDLTFTDIGKYSNGSHEIMLIVKLGEGKKTGASML
jgi:type IX secretion system PorP/SprF family membrane protein